VLVKLAFEPAPLLLGFVLGPMIEEYFRRAMIIARGDAWVFLQKPISASMLVIAAILLVITFIPAIAKKREEVFVEEDK
jgi:TctA family transporter